MYKQYCSDLKEKGGIFQLKGFHKVLGKNDVGDNEMFNFLLAG